MIPLPHVNRIMAYDYGEGIAEFGFRLYEARNILEKRLKEAKIKELNRHCIRNMNAIVHMKNTIVNLSIFINTDFVSWPFIPGELSYL